MTQESLRAQISMVTPGHLAAAAARSATIYATDARRRATRRSSRRRSSPMRTEFIRRLRTGATARLTTPCGRARRQACRADSANASRFARVILQKADPVSTRDLRRSTAVEAAIQASLDTLMADKAACISPSRTASHIARMDRLVVVDTATSSKGTHQELAPRRPLCGAVHASPAASSTRARGAGHRGGVTPDRLYGGRPAKFALEPMGVRRPKILFAPNAREFRSTNCDSPHVLERVIRRAGRPHPFRRDRARQDRAVVIDAELFHEAGFQARCDGAKIVPTVKPARRRTRELGGHVVWSGTPRRARRES